MRRDGQGGKIVNKMVAASPSKCFGRQLRTLRKQRNMSQEGLAQRVTEIGVPMGQSMVGRLENGTRTLSLDDAIALALAVGAPLMHLLSVGRDERLALAPKVHVDAEQAYKWFLGLEGAPGTEFADEIAPSKPTLQLEQTLEKEMQARRDRLDALDRRFEELEERFERERDRVGNLGRLALDEIESLKALTRRGQKEEKRRGAH
jgi:transcriptional regulator with XRE-family HTH domain